MLASLALDTNSHISMARFARAHFDNFHPIALDKQRVRWGSARFARSAPDCLDNWPKFNYKRKISCQLEKLCVSTAFEGFIIQSPLGLVHFITRICNTCAETLNLTSTEIFSFVQDEADRTVVTCNFQELLCLRLRNRWKAFLFTEMRVYWEIAENKLRIT